MKQFVVDAFTDKLFSGNPAAVCLTNSWPPGSLMQNMARENGLSETAFAVKEAGCYGLRWFTPGGEIDLCGHATLATAFVIMTRVEPDLGAVAFKTKSGVLTVRRSGDLFEMDFPAYELKEVGVTSEMSEAIGTAPLKALLGRDLLCVLASPEAVKNATPDLEKVERLPGLLLHLTAEGSGDFACVSRSFGPKFKIPEDPVCGSGHCHIVPYWAGATGKAEFKAFQASARGGALSCKLEGGRVKLAGKAALYSEAEVFV